VNTFFTFAHFRNSKFLKFGNVSKTRAQLIFPSKPNFFKAFLFLFLEFLATKSLTNQYLPHLSSKESRTQVGAHPYSSRAFKRYQECNNESPWFVWKGDLGVTTQNKTKQTYLAS
jgi:hypothetical protein